MQVHSDPSKINLSRPVVSIGIFDGVHRGHRNLIEQMKAEASRLDRETLVITFWPHPRFVLGKADPGFKLLTTLEEKTELLKAAGIDHLLVVRFTESFAAQEPDEFLNGFIDQYIQPSLIVAGDDPRFGRSGKGTLRDMVEFGKTHGFSVISLDTHEEGRERISSTRIRACLAAGDLQAANRLLGYPYRISGEVVSGNRIGHTIGFPTANIRIADPVKQFPADGVYAVMAKQTGSILKGMLNIGHRPTIGKDDGKTMEVHLFDHTGDIYGKTLEIRFIARLRDEMKFSGIGELSQQLEKDRIHALHELRNAPRIDYL